MKRSKLKQSKIPFCFIINTSLSILVILTLYFIPEAKCSFQNLEVLILLWKKKKGHFHLSGKLPPVYTRNWNFNFCKDKSASMRDVKVISQARGSWIQYLWFGKTKPNFILALQQIMRSCPQLVNFHQPCWSIMDLELHEHIHFRRDSSLCQC